MELLIGGVYQGKKEVARTLFGLQEKDILDGTFCQPEELLQAKAVCEWHMLIRRMMEQGESPEEFFAQIVQKNPSIILISNEIGYGIVPIEPFEREWRERTGRICCLAAEKANHVIRIMAGNPVCIKGEALW